MQHDRPPCGSVGRFYHVEIVRGRRPLCLKRGSRRGTTGALTCLVRDSRSPAFRRPRGVPRELRGFLTAEMTAPDRAGHRDRTDLTGWDERSNEGCWPAPARQGFLGVSLPPEYGGGGSRELAGVVSFEAAYHDAPMIDTAAVLVAPTVLAFGSDAQRSGFLPAATAGSCTACIAYTEAGAGSDLAQHHDDRGRRRPRTGSCSTARRCSSPGHTRATGAARSRGPTQRPRGSRGLSMFLIDMHAAGVTVERVPTANGWTLGTIRFDRRASVAMRCSASARQRLAATRRGVAERTLGHGVAGMGEPQRAGTRRRVSRNVRRARTRDALADLVTRLFVGLRHAERVLAIQDAGGAPVVEAAISKVWATELLQRIAFVGDALLGRELGARAGLDRRRCARELVRLRD